MREAPGVDAPPPAPLTLAITRSASDGPAWADAVAAVGHIPRLFPCLRVEALKGAELADALEEGLSWADWVAFTSPRAAALVPSIPGRVRIAAVGPRSQEACVEAFGRVDLVAPGGRARDLALALIALPQGVRPRRLLFPAAEGARPELPERLAEGGVTVRQLALYRVAPAPAGAGPETGLGGVDYILLASPSAAQGLVNRCGGAPTPPVVTIGPTTTQEARQLGLNVVGEAARRGIDGLLDALPERVSQGRGP